MNNLDGKATLKEAVEELLRLSEEPVAGPRFLDRVKGVLDVFTEANNQEAIKTILEPHMLRIQALVLNAQGLTGKITLA